MHKGKIIRNILVIIILIFFVLGVVYFLFGRDSEKAKITVTSDQSNKIVIEDKFPMLDKVGKNIKYDKDNSSVQGYYEFVVKNESDKKTKYEIYASDFDYENKIHPNYIKVYLTDSLNKPMPGFDGVVVPTFFNLTVAKLTPKGKRLYYGTLKGGESKKFILRVWVGDAYAIGENSNDFGMNIYVEAE